jgi:EAL domain-containing protein (putative c-di-GMP-specific phosphodiesterase class I)
MKVVAEGTERLEEIHELQNLGCDYAQGFYFSRPVHEDAALKLLSSGGLQNGFTVSRGAATS